MGTYKQDRAAEDIKRELAAIMRELKDPRVSDHLISVARAEVASDSSYVKVYVSAVEGIDVAKAAAKAERELNVKAYAVICICKKVDGKEVVLHRYELRRESLQRWA